MPSRSNFFLGFLPSVIKIYMGKAGKIKFSENIENISRGDQ